MKTKEEVFQELLQNQVTYDELAMMYYVLLSQQEAFSKLISELQEKLIFRDIRSGECDSTKFY